MCRSLLGSVVSKKNQWLTIQCFNSILSILLLALALLCFIKWLSDCLQENAGLCLLNTALSIAYKNYKMQIQDVKQNKKLPHYLCGLHMLLPMPIPDSRILQLTHSPQWRQHVLDGRLQPAIGIPRSHLLVQWADVLGKLLTVDLHLLYVDLLPESGLPVVDTTGGWNVKYLSNSS